MRENLKKARKEAGMTQKQVAEYLGIAEQHYQRIEYGKTIGKIEIWDKLEDLFNVHQRFLRKMPDSHFGKEERQGKHQE